MANDGQEIDSFFQKMDGKAGLAPVSPGPQDLKKGPEYDPEIDTAAVLRAALQPEPDANSERDTLASRKELMLEAMRETEFYKYLMISSDVEDFKRRILVLVNKLGFTDFGFTLMSTVREIDGLLSSVPSGLAESYYVEAFHEHDITLKYLAVNKNPIFRSAVDEFVNGASFKTEEITRNQELTRLIRSYGYEDYYGLPMESRSGGRCLFTVQGISMPKHLLQERVEGCKGRLELLCCAIDYICAIRFTRAMAGSKRSETIKLTTRPQELLTHLAINDCNLNQAAQAMNISVKTANVHIATVKKAFGVTTSTAAVAHAIKHGFINLDQLG